MKVFFRWTKKNKNKNEPSLDVPGVIATSAVETEVAPDVAVSDAEQKAITDFSEISTASASGGSGSSTGDKASIIDDEVKLIIEHLNATDGVASVQDNSDDKSAQYQSQKVDELPDSEDSRNATSVEVEESNKEKEDTLLKRLRAGFKRSAPLKEGESDKKISLKTILGLESSYRGSVPVKIMMGYLPDVLERDAMEYAMGVADRNCEQSSITYFDVFKYDGGYVYEIHEGGRGKAYTPEILKLFEESGDFDNLKPVKVHIHTAMRTVEVEKLRKGLVAVWLPESKRMDTTPGLEPTHDLIPATNQRTGFLVISASFFIVSFLSMIVSAITQYQPYEPAQEVKQQELDYSKSVSGQWGRISDAVQMGKIVKAVKYEGGVWRALEVEEQASADSAASAPVPGISSGRKE